MTKLTLNPYLMFNGNAEQAIRHYEKALGAKTEHLMRFSEMPGDKVAPEIARLVMHAQLRVGESAIMISDAMPGQPAVAGDSVQVCLQLEDPVDAAAKFDALAEGGKVKMALHDTFWGAKFGTLVDSFGVPWMFNCQLEKP